ncbi:MAG: hypothetical protein MMC33_006764 [Icmadophila ericetorum]|nr:hypothetical protein [Icmadophila ericetorum]
MDEIPVPWLPVAFSGQLTAFGALLSVLWVFLGISAWMTRQQSAKFSPPLVFNRVSKIISRRIHAWAYLLNGPTIIQRGFEKSHGELFEVLAPDARMVFVSSPKYIKELDDAPDNALSLNAAAKHMLQPLYTMNGFNWFDRRGTEGVGFVRTLRTLLTNNLPQLLPDLTVLTRTRFAELRSQRSVVINGAAHSPIYPMMMDIVVLLNAYSLFGKDLASNEQWKASALAYVEETLLNAEVVKLMPKFLAPLVGGVLSRRLNAHKSFFQSLTPVAEERCRERDREMLGHAVPKHSDCISWIIATAPRQKPWSAERVIYELMAIWFGSVHILSTTIVFVIHDLCLHPEYVEPLRNEIEAQYAEFERTGRGLLLLDSFIKESSRLSPVESMSVRRCALQPFALSDGTKLEVGDWACAPSGAINCSAEHYPEPLKFNGFRFADPSVFPDERSSVSQQPKPSKLTDVDNSFLMWGTGRMACPGRYYASAFMKVVVAQIIINYDLALVEPDAPRWVTWRAARLPKAATMVTFIPR